MTLSAARLTASGIRRYSLDEEARTIFGERGFHLLRKHFYLPIPEAEDLGEEFWSRRSEMPGVDTGDEEALACLRELFPAYLGEFRETFPLLHQSADEPERFYLLNGSFMTIDAHVYYCLVRRHRPRRIVEIGAGNSTVVAAAACARNAAEGGPAARLTAIDPFPLPVLKRGLPGVSELIEDKVQNVPLELFTSLGEGDILFIDSTHVLREGGDVQVEYCEILPRLAPGVLVHVHDISLPKAYPRVYFERHQLYWNEQYLLQAFLAFNSRFKVVWPGNYMMLNYPQDVCSVFPEYHAMREAFPSSEPASFWMRVAGGAGEPPRTSRFAE